MKNNIQVIFGNLLLAIAVQAFIIPSQIPMGGATGFALAIHHFFGFRTSIVVFVVNALLLIIAGIFFGKEFVKKTILSTLIYPILLEMVALIPGISTITNDLMLCALFGGILVGCAMGLVVQAGGSTGGSDIVALLLNRFTKWSVGTSVYIIDFCILALQAVFSNKEMILFGIVLTIVITTIINRLLPDGKVSLQVMIISSQYEIIRKNILFDIQAGTTLFYIETGYAKEQQKGILCVIPRHKLFALKEMVYQVDPYAFLTISVVSEVDGQGFSTKRLSYEEYMQQKIVQ
ncbi:YitT family protein [Floccifex sp.]|uniref:YitT family protein n=1 Tax=Floccifex sp. TaxID=2815810 RepID=UPI003F0DAD1F